MKIVVAAEWYRTPEQTYDDQDYMVDGVILFRFQDFVFEGELEKLEDAIEAAFSPLLKRFITGFAEAPEQAQQSFPKFARMLASGAGHWFKVTTDKTLEALPKDFHGNNFSEAELLGVPESDVEKFEVLFNSAGDRIAGHPDKFMLSLGAA